MVYWVENFNNAAPNDNWPQQDFGIDFILVCSVSAISGLLRAQIHSSIAGSKSSVDHPQRVNNRKRTRYALMFCIQLLVQI